MNFKKKLKEEQDVKAELLRRAQDVLQSKKQLREAYAIRVEEKEALEENLRQLMKANEVNESTPSIPLTKLKNDYEALKRENEELHVKLKEKQEQEVREKENFKNETPQKSPEVLAKLEENEKLKKQISEVEREKRELENQNQRAEEQRQQSIHKNTQLPDQESSESFFISAQDARTLAQKIKKMQQELGDLGLRHHQLQLRNHQLTTELEEERHKAQESNPAAPQEDTEEAKIQKELEEERERKEEIQNKYNTLVDLLFSLQSQLKPAIVSQEQPEVIVETIKKFLEGLALEQRIDQNIFSQRFAQEESDKKILKRGSVIPPPLTVQKKPKSGKLTKRKTNHRKKEKKTKEGDEE